MKRTAIAAFTAAAAGILLATSALPASAATGLTPSNCGKLTTNTDGTVAPIICPNGHPNALAWPVIKKTTPAMSKLGAKATWKQVTAATCTDLKKASNPMAVESFQWLATRYGWLGKGLPGAESYGMKIVNGLCG